jgi:hypothetical protein
MIHLDPPVRAATPDDAAALTDLVHFASEGLALYVWTRIAGPAGDPWVIGRERAAKRGASPIATPWSWSSRPGVSPPR